MVGRASDWKEELGRFLKPFLDRLGHKARRQMCSLYVSGLNRSWRSQDHSADGGGLGLANTINCSPVSLTLARGEVPVMLALRPFLPAIGRASGLCWSERVFRQNIERHEPNRRWLGIDGTTYRGPKPSRSQRRVDQGRIRDASGLNRGLHCPRSRRREGGAGEAVTRPVAVIRRTTRI